MQNSWMEARSIMGFSKPSFNISNLLFNRVILIFNITGYIWGTCFIIPLPEWPQIFFSESPWLVTYDFENKDVLSSSIPSPLAEWFSPKNWHIKPDNISNLLLPWKWLQDKNKYSLCSIYSIRTEQGIYFNAHKSAYPILVESHLAFM